MRKKKGNKSWICILVFAVLGIILLTTIYFFRPIQVKGVVLTDNEEQYSEMEFGSEYTYVRETTYVGKPRLSAKLFGLPYQRTDAYINNIEFIKQFGEDNAAIIADKAINVTNNLIDAQYKDLPSINEELLSTISKGVQVYFLSGEEAVNNKQALEYIFNWYKDTKTSIEAELITDKCLVFYDENKVIVRGLLTFTVYETEDIESLKKSFLSSKLEIGKANTVLVDFEFVPGSNNKDFSKYSLVCVTPIVKVQG